MAAFSGPRNTRELMEAIDSGKAAYDFVEVMTCSGGCAGGQPIHEGQKFAAVRGDNLWKLDAGSETRFSHENPDVRHCIGPI